MLSNKFQNTYKNALMQVPTDRHIHTCTHTYTHTNTNNRRMQSLLSGKRRQECTSQKRPMKYQSENLHSLHFLRLELSILRPSRRRENENRMHIIQTAPTVLPNCRLRVSSSPISSGASLQRLRLSQNNYYRHV